MLDINLIRNDPEKVRENIRKKFQDAKLPMVDEVISLDREFRRRSSRPTPCATSARPSPRRSAV